MRRCVRPCARAHARRHYVQASAEDAITQVELFLNRCARRATRCPPAMPGSRAPHRSLGARERRPRRRAATAAWLARAGNSRASLRAAWGGAPGAASDPLLLLLGALCPAVRLRSVPLLGSLSREHKMQLVDAFNEETFEGEPVR